MARLELVLAGEISKWLYALDVLGHAALGAAVSILPIGGVVWFGGGFWLSMAVGEPIALSFGAWRERRQWKKTGYDPAKLHLKDRIWDTIHHVLGPPLAFGLLAIAGMLLRRALGP